MAVADTIKKKEKKTNSIEIKSTVLSRNILHQNKGGRGYMFILSNKQTKTLEIILKN